MKKETRTKKSLVNSIYATASQIMTVILSFVVRTVFVKMLTVEYLGINGLFSNIITMLSLADLGVGIAIPYTLYKPLAEENKEKIKVLMNFYKKIYNFIGFIVLVIGIMLTPFLGFIIKEIPNIENIKIIYILFVINASVSYFFIYKKLLIDSDQKGYIANKIIMICTLIKTVFEIIVLYLTRNYILYLIISIIISILQNVLISIKCNKIYPYITESTNDIIKKEDVIELKKNIFALMIYRIGTVVLTGTDNIIISKILGVVAVGIYSNYLLIESSLTRIISKISEAITASIGNLVVTTDNEKSKDIFYKLMFFNNCIYSLCAILLTVLINPFINLWLGEEYLLSNVCAFAIGLNFYIYGMQNVVSSFRNAYGLFVQGRYRPILMVIVNIIVSIVLAKYIGILGVIIGTIVSRLFITGIYDPIIVFKYGLKSNVIKYFITYFKYLIIYIFISTISMIVINLIAIENIFTWIITAIILVVIITIIFMIIFHNDEKFTFFLNAIKNIIRYKKV